MNVLLVMERRVNAGSIQAAASYIRAGDELGHAIALYGREDPQFPALRFSDDIEKFDYVVFIIEARSTWLSGLRIPRILEQVPRERRVVVDTDGAFNAATRIDRYDFNHLDQAGCAYWREVIKLLGDRVYQPTLGSTDSDVIGLPFFGYDPGVGPLQRTSTKKFDIIHIGHNWWRWRQIESSFLPAVRKIRRHLDGICFVGAWWDQSPAWASAIGLEEAFQVDAEQFKSLKIQVRDPIPYVDVLEVMGAARINLMTQRPILNHFGLLTSKYFEIFCADTIPLVMLGQDRVESVYGPAGGELALDGDIEGKILDVLARPDYYQEVVGAVREHLEVHHSFPTRVQELVEALSGGESATTSSVNRTRGASGSLQP
jgi:hypothetical protein